MSDSLLEAIRRSPADDAPRLVYADWLEEAGDPDRAAFIRAQCRFECDDPPPNRDALEDSAADLLATHERAWLGAAGVPLIDCRFRRGFLHAACGPLADVEEWWPTLRAAHPLVSNARLLPASEGHGSIVYFLRREPPTGLTGLRVPGRLTPEAFEALVTWPGLRQLRSLDLSGSLPRVRRDPKGLRRLLAGLAGLESLSLADNDLSVADVDTLVLSPAARTLRSLDLSRNAIQADGAARVLGARELPELRHLALSDCRIGGTLERTPRLVADPRCEHLDSLDLSNNPLSVRIEAALGTGAVAGRIRALSIGSDSWDGPQAARVLAGDGFGRLDELSVRVSRGVEALADLPVLGRLRGLCLAGTLMPPAAAARVLARLEGGPIRALALGQIDVSERGALAVLLSSPTLGRLRDLWLRLVGLSWLEAGPLLARLSHLSLTRLGLTTAGARYGEMPGPLARPLPAGGFARLHTLALSLNGGDRHALAAVAPALAPGALRRVAAADGMTYADECARLAATPAWASVRRWWARLPPAEAARFDAPGGGRERLPGLREMDRVEGDSPLAARAYLPADGGPVQDVIDDRGPMLAPG